MSAPVPASPQRASLGSDIPNLLRRHARSYRAARLGFPEFVGDACGELVIAAAVLSRPLGVSIDLFVDNALTAWHISPQKNWSAQDIMNEMVRSEGGIILP